jgi:acetoacetyl-CoA reductase
LICEHRQHLAVRGSAEACWQFPSRLNISSINGQKGQMGQANYSAAKAGELGFTKALAQEGARSGITVNAICPGYINTEMVQAVPKDVLERKTSD